LTAIRGIRGVAGIFIALFALVGCQAFSTASSLPGGRLIEPPERPDPAACEVLLADDVDAQLHIRAALGVEGVPATKEAVAAAAGGERVFGVPLSTAEIESLRAAGITEPDQAALLAGLAFAHPDTFAGVRIEDGATVVQLLRIDDVRLRTARCLEVGDTIGRVRYETAGASTAELDAPARERGG